MSLTVHDFDIIVRKLKMAAKGGRHRVHILEHDGRQVIWTMRSHGRGDIGRVEHAVRRQLRVSVAQLADLKNCPMTRDAYIEHLKRIGIIQASSQ